MFPEVGATELMVIAAVALIVVGPKDLPVLLRKAGQFMSRMRGMASEFRASFDEMARQSELDELRREVQALRSGEYLQPVDAAASAHAAPVQDTLAEIEQDLTAMPGHWAEAGDAQPEVQPPPEPAPAPPSPRPRPRAKAPARAASTKAAAPVKPPARPRAKPKPKPKPEPET